MTPKTYILLSLTLLIFLSACGQGETAENNASTAGHVFPGGFDPEQSGQEPGIAEQEPGIALQQQSDNDGSTIDTAIKIDVGSAVSSNLSAYKNDLIFDTDFFVFDMAAGCTYNISVDLITAGAVPGDFNLSLRARSVREEGADQVAATDALLVNDNDTSMEDFSDTNPEPLMITWTVPSDWDTPTPVYIKFLSYAIQDTDYELAVETDDPGCNLSDKSLPVRMENWGVGHSEMVVWDDTGAPEYLVKFKVNTVALKVVDQNQEPFNDSGHRDVSPISTVYADGDAVVPENGPGGTVRYWHRLEEVGGNTPPVGQLFEMTIKDVYNGGELDPNKRRDCLDWSKNNCCAEGQCRINLNSYQLTDNRFNNAVYTGDPRSRKRWDPSTRDKLDGSQVFEIAVLEKDSGGSFVSLPVRGGNTVIADKSMNKQFTKSNGDAYYATPGSGDPEYCLFKEDGKVCGLASELAYVAETGDISTWTVKLKWNYPPGRSGVYDYEIYRAEDTGGDYKDLDWEHLTTVIKKSNSGTLPAFGSQQWVDGSGDTYYPENGKTYAYAVVPRYFKYAGPDGQHTVYNSRSVYHNKLVNDIHAELGYMELFPPTHPNATVNADHVLRGILIPAAN